MYLDRHESLKGQIVLIDPFIHKKAKLSKAAFLEKINDVKYLRTAVNSNYISFYITSVEEYINLVKFHELVNKGIFDFNFHEVFAVSIQPKLYEWFKTTDINTIQKQIVSWMSGLYFFNPEKRNLIKQQVYSLLYEEIQTIIEKYYAGFHVSDFSDLDDESTFDERNCLEKYKEVCLEIYSSEPPEFLKSPFGYEYEKEWGLNSYHNFEFVMAYITENDWDRIVIKGKNGDDLDRVESRDDLWLKWKHVYTTFDQRKNFVYSFYIENNSKNTKTTNRKREPISKHVKNEVWQRDKGMCVSCGSKEKLEFDHIIPHSKGGSSTYRNLQLLCEKCNRTKHANI